MNEVAEEEAETVAKVGPDPATFDGVENPASGAVRVPRSVIWLGALGAIPFVSIAVAVPFLESDLVQKARYVACGYGAVILSFLGGIHWGLVLAGGDRGNVEAKDAPWLVVGVLPALVGWGALMIAGSVGLLALAIAFYGMFLVDRQAARKGVAPDWYPALRRPLSIVVIVSLAFAALA